MTGHARKYAHIAAAILPLMFAMFAIILILAVILTGCAGLGTGQPGQGGKSDPASDFPSVLGQASGIPEASCILTVNQRGVPAWRYLYWLARVCDRLRIRYGDSGGGPDWELLMEDGRTLGAYAKEQALMDTAMYSVIENLSERYGLALSDEDTRIIAGQWAERCQIHGGESAYLRELARYGLDRSRLEDLTGAGLLYQKLHHLCQSESGARLRPDEAELNAISREFISDSNSVRVDRILASVADTSRGSARNKAESFFSRLNGAADQADLFASLTEQGDDHAGPRNAGDESLDIKLQQVARTLQIGQVSGILETDEGFSILIRLPPERSELLSTWLDRYLERQAEGADILLSERWQNLDTADFYNALEQAREKL